ncbi:Ion transport, K+ channel [Alcanivorax hongdengensis A-11-3]|uniref:Ion transport, K+ channel n=1 Tax=Alcanivorax hongdengensis A-11-3 TaxID=1177179 RepID=L0W9S3_9GAMM|nr:potassium channel family protein [Alcanivorax hongdengensis]EKF73749.1 Ion transport, K+ channel [Alcanivorax hongdengensis A-11-3]
MEFTVTFLQYFGKAMLLSYPLLGFFVLVITLLGLMVARLEGWPRHEGLYWAFITALTVGYGDRRPSRRSTQALAVATAVVGIMFSGIFVAVTVAAATQAFQSYFAA